VIRPPPVVEIGTRRRGRPTQGGIGRGLGAVGPKEASGFFFGKNYAKLSSMPLRRPVIRCLST
jgi:hypothetical protein